MANNKHRPLIDMYRQSFAEFGDSPSGVLWPRGRQSLRFHALTRHFSHEGFSVLDYGCGLAHLKPFLAKNFTNFEYRGADLVPEFITAVRNKYHGTNVMLIDSCFEITEPVDHVVISGSFNIIEGNNRANYMEQVKQTLVHLFGLTRLSLSVNFMTDKVDYTQPDAFHVNPGEMMEFMNNHLSPRVLCDATYMPYEFTLITLKDSDILRPDNIYRPI